MLPNLYFFLMILPLSLCLPFPFPLRDKTGKVRTTQLCGEVQLDGFTAELIDCLKEANTPLDKAISAEVDTEILEAAICKTITDKVQCINDIGPNCYNSTQMSNLNNNFVLSQLDLAYNSTTLGTRFIQSCPILNQNQAEVAEYITGSTVCSYEEYKEAKVEFEACKEAAKIAWNNRMDLLNFVSDPSSLFITALCKAKSDDEACRVPFVSCFGGEQEATFTANAEKYFAELERSAKREASAEFSFQNSCGYL